MKNTAFKLILTLLIITASSVTVPAAQIAIDGIKYDIDSYDHATITGYTSDLPSSVIIPYEVHYVNGEDKYMFFVTKIAPDAFVGSGITELTLADDPYDIPDKYDDLLIGAGAFNIPTLKKIIINRPDVPVVEPESEIFNPDIYKNAELVFGSKLTDAQVEEYKKSYPWNQFLNGVITGIGSPETSSLSVTSAGGSISFISDKPVEIFTIDGRRIYSGDSSTIMPGKGVFIIRSGEKSVKVAD